MAHSSTVYNYPRFRLIAPHKTKKELFAQSAAVGVVFVVYLWNLSAQPGLVIGGRLGKECFPGGWVVLCSQAADYFPATAGRVGFLGLAVFTFGFCGRHHVLLRVKDGGVGSHASSVL